MKIEMGESLMYSYLRHVKGCQIVQTNWKVSPSWDITNTEKLHEIMSVVSVHYKEMYDMEIFGVNSLSQLLKQAETDVIGVSLFPEPYIYGIDVAFHENGLMYGNKYETAGRIIKKYVRTIMCIVGYTNYTSGEVIFAAPKANKNVLDVTLALVEELNDLLKISGLNFKISFFTNEDFYDSILSPIMLQSRDISDTSELFLRSYQMIKLFENNHTSKPKSIIKPPHSENEYLSIAALNQLKIGKLVQYIINYMTEYNLFTETILTDLLSNDKSKHLFGINYAVLKDITDCSDKDAERKDNRGYSRYYSKPLEINGRTYLLCQEWNEQTHRNNFDNWYKGLFTIE